MEIGTSYPGFEYWLFIGGNIVLTTGDSILSARYRPE